jgi:hypothetical protein
VPERIDAKRRRVAAAFGLLVVLGSLSLLWLRHGTGSAIQPTLEGTLGPASAAKPEYPRSEVDDLENGPPPRSQAAEDLPTLASAVDAGGGLCLLSPGSLTPAAGSRWALEGPEPEQSPIIAVADDFGRLGVGPGVWTLQALDTEWISPPGSHLVDPGSEQIVWIQRAVSRQFKVLGPSDVPLHGAMALWRPRTVEGAGGGSTDSPFVRGTTDAAGIVVFESGPFENGDVTFLYPEHDRVRLSMCGPPESEVTVRLTPSKAGRLLRFAPSDSNVRLETLAITTDNGMEIARANEPSIAVQLPGWVDPSEPLRVIAPGVFPCQFRLRDLTEDLVILPTVIAVPFLVEDGTGCREPISIFVRPTESSLAGAVEPRIPSVATATRAGEVARIELPDGSEVEVRAMNGCGALESRRFVVSAVDEAIQLSLGASGSVLLAVRSSSGNPLPTARASVSGLATFQAADDGIVRVPSGPSTRSIQVTAAGHGTAVLSRISPGEFPQASTEHVTVTLPTGCRALVTVRSAAGHPLAGMRVRAWPPTASEPLPLSSGWTVGRTSVAVVATSDGQGRCTLSGVPAGMTRIEVDLPPMLGTDPWRQSAYPPVRFERKIDDGSSIEVEVPEPVQIALQVLDATTGRPVEGFTLFGQAATVPPIEVSGDYWQGWVASSARRFLVVVEGLGSTEFTMDHARNQARHMLRVAPTSATLLRIIDPGSLPSGARLLVQVMEPSAEGLHIVASMEAVIDDRGESWLDLGPWPGAWIALGPILVGDARLRFDPEAQPAVLGGELVFRPVVDGG